MSDNKAPEQERYQIEINSLELYAYHGVFPEEKKLGQKFEIDLTLDVLSNGLLADDSLDHVLSYVDVVDKVCRIFTGQTFDLLEAAAKVILEELGCFSEIQHAKIRIKKVAPPIPTILGFVSVLLEKKY